MDLAVSFLILLVFIALVIAVLREAHNAAECDDENMEM